MKKNKGLGMVLMTRKCRRNCKQCSIKVNIPNSPIEKWKEWIPIIEGLSEFIIVLGNDPWLYGPELVKIFTRTTAIYSAGIWEKKRHIIFPEMKEALVKLKNFSIGYDFPITINSIRSTQNHIKSNDAYWYAKNIRNDLNMKDVEIYLSCTLYKENVNLYESIYKDAVELNAFLSYNFLNYNSDGKFDFFPGLNVLKNWLVEKEEYERVKQFILSSPKDRFYIWEPFEYFSFEEMTRMKWHCKGNPYDGPTVDYNGQMRVCGYRAGERSSKLHITDLQSSIGIEQWQEAVYKDAMDCPGCSWSCPMSYHIRGVRKHDKEVK